VPQTREAIPPRKAPAQRCEALAWRGTGTVTCDRPLDRYGQCDRAASHVPE